MTKEQEKQLDNILIMFHSDDTLYDNEEYHRRKKAIFTLVDRIIKAGQVEPVVSVKIAKAVDEIISVIYLSDNSDYINTLWTVLGLLDKEAYDLADSDIDAAYIKYSDQDISNFSD